MLINTNLLAGVFLALAVALVVSFLASPVVKAFAYKVGAIDVPKDNRRMHHIPIPRLGGLAIFLGFIVSILLFAKMTNQFRSILLGAVIIVVLGVVDDITPLPAKFKFLIQIGAALIPTLNGVQIHVLSNPNLFSPNPYWDMGVLSIPVTVLWIVAITNAVNLIDGLDGLAIGVSAISATTVLVISLLVSEVQVAVVMAALVGACVGFMPYNLNPAKMFMGDTGATFLGYILACMSVEGLFKSWAIISFAVPFLILGLPIFDTAFAILRRLAHGQSPMQADRSHIHHRLIDMGLNQKQAVATLYVISAILGLSAVVLTTSGELRAMMIFVSLCVVAVVAARVIFPKEVREELHEEMEELRDHGHRAEKQEKAEDAAPPAGEELEQENLPGLRDGNSKTSQEETASALADAEPKAQEPDGWEGEEDQ
ncbi:MraY family glycosyltransferase [Oscillibacter sp.]|uniref:MraY family glycosyltransferase n=1 Tax=Oscillibacter sp. TaxID=1945593 RepID=UPI0028A07569|nr:MraY family glycosyltransferase [Oscillibacter sp.]